MNSNNNKKVHAFRGAALITAAVLAVTLLFTACPNNAGGGGSAATVNITVTGDANVNVPSEPVAVRAGAKWAEAKSTVQGKISPKPNFLMTRGIWARTKTHRSLKTRTCLLKTPPCSLNRGRTYPI